VLKLVRTGIGPLTLAGLEIGKYRRLPPEEVTALKKSGSRSQKSEVRRKETEVGSS
jgi:16S rRNA U516 pseudouridylate synthase RsuA-like enzyme